MVTQIIKKDDSSFALQSQMPYNWDREATVTVDIIDTQGNDIVSDGAVVRYTADTLSTAVLAGVTSIVLVAGNALVAGQNIEVGSEAEGWEPLIVDNYTASTKTVEFTTHTSDPHAAGSNIVGTDLTYDLDASVAGFDDVTKVSILWKPSGDGQAMTEVWTVQSRQTQVAGLEGEYKGAYSDLASSLSGPGFAMLKRRADTALSLYFRSRQRNMNLITDSELIKELIMLQMAKLQGYTSPISTEAHDRIITAYNELLQQIDDLNIWTDTDEDSIEEDHEVQKGVTFGISRPL